MGTKRSEIYGAFGCSACHDAVDGRQNKMHDTYLVRLWFYEGVHRTQDILLDEGLISV